MRTDSSSTLWVSLLLALSLSTAGCVSLAPPLENIGRASTSGVGVEPPYFRVMTSESEAPERSNQHWRSRDEVTAMESDGAEKDSRRSALAAQLAFRGAVLDVSGSARRISGELVRFKRSNWGLAGANGVFLRYADYGAEQLRWIDAELAAATRMANTASEVDDPNMQLALLRMAGPRLEAAMVGSLLLGVWLDFLSLADVALKQRIYSVEALFVDLWRWQELLEPAMSALSSGEHVRMEATAQDLPALIGHLTSEFSSIVERMRVGAETVQKLLMFKEAIEAATMLSTMRFSLPAVPPSAPALVGIGLAVGRDGVMMGTRMVVSAEWVEWIRHLVQAGVLSLPVVGAAVRIQAGQVMLSEARGELPRRVRDALGDGPEVSAMHETGKAGAGMAESPRHHVMPKEHREWFEKRGFSGETNIDEFCVELEQSHHEAIHGGGHWKMGRTWPGEWNRMVMKSLFEAEARAGQMLTRDSILRIVAANMKRYRIPMKFVPWRGP